MHKLSVGYILGEILVHAVCLGEESGAVSQLLAIVQVVFGRTCWFQ